MMLPPEVHAVVIISSPGSGFIAATQVCSAEVPEFTEIPYLIPYLFAYSFSKAFTSGPIPISPDLITLEMTSISSSPKSCPAKLIGQKVRVGLRTKLIYRSYCQ